MKNESKKFAYLVQGRAGLVKGFGHLHSHKSDLYFLTYDVPLVLDASRAVFDPNISWAGGRNLLLDLAKPSDYDYYIFVDDDAQLVQGSFDVFEELLLENLPYLGLPLCDEIEKSGRWCRHQAVQIPIAFDQIMQAFSRDAVSDQILLPYCTRFDELSWWYSCEVNQYQVLSQFRQRAAQFNSVRVYNSVHDWNDGQISSGSSYKGGVTPEGLALVRQWLDNGALTEDPGPWAIQNVPHELRQASWGQFVADAKIAFSIRRPINFRRRIRKTKSAIMSMASIIAYATFWRGERVNLCVEYVKYPSPGKGLDLP